VYKTSIYTLVNGNMTELAHRKQQKLLLKYCFPTGDQLERYCTSDIFTVAKLLISYNSAVTYYLMA